MCSNNDFIKDVAEGSAKGILNWSKEQVEEIVFKIKNKKLLFIGDKNTINLVKSQHNSPEWEIYNRYLKLNRGDELRILILMGLSLRRLAGKKEIEKLQSLREIIKRKYKSEGLHIAQFIQNDLGKYFGSMISKSSSMNELKENLEEILKNIDKYVKFIQEWHKPIPEAEKIKILVLANLPKAFVISSVSSAIPVAKEIKEILEPLLEDYFFETFEKREKYICFLDKKIEEI